MTIPVITRNNSDGILIEDLLLAVLNEWLGGSESKKNSRQSEKPKSQNTASDKHHSCSGKGCEGCVGCMTDHDVTDEYVPKITNLINRVIFDDPFTAVAWIDGTMTEVRVSEGDTFNKEVGIALALLKKLFGDDYYKQIHYVAKEFSYDVTAHKENSKRNTEDLKKLVDFIKEDAKSSTSNTAHKTYSSNSSSSKSSSSKSTSTKPKSTSYKSSSSKTSSSKSSSSKSSSSKSSTSKSTSSKSKTSAKKSTSSKSTSKKS